MLKVVKLDFWMNKIFGEMLGKASNVSLTLHSHSDAVESIQSAFQQAHVYQICAARDEVPVQWQAHEDLLAQCPSLLAITTSGAGYDPVDVDACTRRAIAVFNQSGCNADSVAEHMLGMLLSLKHRIAESDRVIRAGECSTREALMGNEIRGLTLGVIGFGNVGSRVAPLAQACGLSVLAYDPYVSEQQMRAQGVEPCSFAALLERSDVVSVHCPRTKETLKLFDKNAFAAMKPGAVFITTARGGIHDEDALYEVLVSQHLSAAGLDVWSVEPPKPQHPLLSLPNVVATFHTAGVTHQGRFNAARMAAEQILHLANGQVPARLVNPQVWPEFQQRYQALLGHTIGDLK